MKRRERERKQQGMETGFFSTKNRRISNFLSLEREEVEKFFPFFFIFIFFPSFLSILFFFLSFFSCHRWRGKNWRWTTQGSSSRPKFFPTERKREYSRPWIGNTFFKLFSNTMVFMIYHTYSVLERIILRESAEREREKENGMEFIK